MTDFTTPPPNPYGSPQTPWGQPPKQKHTARNIALIIAGTLVILAVIGAIVGPKKKTSATVAAATTQAAPPAAATGPASAASSAAPAVTPAPTPSPTAARGIPNSGDVTLGAITPGDFGEATVPVAIVNHSSKRSNYLVSISLETADGKTQLDTTFVSADNVESGQTSPQTGEFTKVTAANMPAGAVVKLTEVTRYAS